MTPPADTAPSTNSREILDELDHAIADHLVWLKTWHTNLVSEGTKAPRDLAYDPHHLCRFGSWYVKNQYTGLVNQPALRNLANIHKDLHDRAQALSTIGAETQKPLPQGSYTAFMDTFAAFITHARRMEKAFAAASSNMDALTGLHNRQAMMNELEKEHDRIARSGNSACVALGDLDHFKQVNDTYGHGAGDRVLMASAERFLGQLRSYDTVYRYGGEEFLVYLPGADMETASRVVERLRRSLESAPIQLDFEKSIPVTGSFGIAVMDGTVPLKEVITRADLALYQAKDSGRNRLVVWSEELQAVAREAKPA
ncbi:MAG: diguanylate cyclase [Rhodospirillales bacterium]|nr:diguanylate cyclase [Rhodospirillales bacterium]